MLTLKRFKEAVTSHGVQSPFVKQVLSSWAAQNGMTPQDWGFSYNDTGSCSLVTRENMVEKGSKKDHQDKDVGLEVWKFPGVLICKDSMDLTVTPRM